MWKVTTPDGRNAWFVGKDPDNVREMAAELFPGVDVVIEEVDDE